MGIGLVATCVFFLALRPLSEILGYPLGLVVLELALCVLFATFLGHIWGYVYLGNKLNSRFLKVSAQTLMVVFLLYGILVIYDTFMLSQRLDTSFMNALIWLSLMLYIIPAIAFSIAVIRLYKIFGVVAIVSAFLILIPLFVWNTWLLALISISISSTYLLFKASA